MATEVVILLGGNLGNVRRNLALCRDMLSERVGCITSLSQEIESCAWGFTAQEMFVNQAVLIETDLQPEELLRATQCIEQDLGRDRADEAKQKQKSGEVYASRTIDVDIIIYGSQVIDSEELKIPHARMQEREFVLRPMAEVAPQWRHPILNKTTKELLNEVNL